MKQELFDLKRKCSLLLKIKNHKEKMKKEKNYSLFNSETAKKIFLLDKDVETWEFFYQLYNEWDSIGFLDENLGNMIENIIKNKNINLGMHRTGGYCSIDINNIFDNSILYSILKDGILMTGDLLQGVVSDSIISPSKNISPINDMLTAVITLKTSYKNSSIAVLTVLPSSSVTDSLYLIPGMEHEIYQNKDGNTFLKPSLIPGFVLQKNGFCSYIDKEYFISNTKVNNKRK